ARLSEDGRTPVRRPGPSGSARCVPGTRPSSESTCIASQSGRDLDLEFSDAVDSGEQLVAGLHRSDARRRSREDQVARLERVVFGKVGVVLGDGPDQVRKIGLLPLLAVTFNQIAPLEG